MHRDDAHQLSNGLFEGAPFSAIRVVDVECRGGGPERCVGDVQLGAGRDESTAITARLHHLGTVLRSVR